jgi:hypothetical protein
VFSIHLVKICLKRATGRFQNSKKRDTDENTDDRLSQEGCWSNKDDGRSRPGINLQVDPKKDGCSGRDVGWIRKAGLM